MAYGSGSIPIPPPPGGNRTNQHVVGGNTSNFGYSAGTNLANARNLLGQGKEGSFFRNQAEVRPVFGGSRATTASPALTQGQATGNQLQGNTMGLVRPHDDVGGRSGESYQSMGQPVRQHTLNDPSGAEYASMNLRPVAPPPPPAVTTGGPAGGTGTLVQQQTKNPAIGGGGALATAINNGAGYVPPNGGIGAVSTKEEAPKYQSGFAMDTFKQGMQYMFVPGGTANISSMTRAQILSAMKDPRNQNMLTQGYYYDNGHIYDRTPDPVKPAAQTGQSTPTMGPVQQTVLPNGVVDQQVQAYGPSNLPSNVSKGQVYGGRLILGTVVRNGKAIPIVNNPNKPGTTMAHPWWV